MNLSQIILLMIVIKTYLKTEIKIVAKLLIPRKATKNQLIEIYMVQVSQTILSRVILIEYKDLHFHIKITTEIQIICIKIQEINKIKKNKEGVIKKILEAYLIIIRDKTQQIQ